MPPPPATTEPASEASPEKPSVEFELRKPTEEEMSASIMSEQDFVDIARIMPGAISQPAPVPAPPKAAPPVAPQPAEAATPAATPTAQTAPEVLVLDEQDGEPLVGFWDGLTVGEFLSGWAGDPSDPACRSIKVSLCVDGKEVTWVMANRPRPDVEHGGFEIRVSDPSIARMLLQDRISVRASRDDRRSTELIVLPQVIDMARDFRARELERSGQGVGPVAAVPKSFDELSPVLLPIGLPSPNSAAILGREGFIFAYRGQHDVVSQYHERGSAVEVDVNAWLALFRAREVALRERGIAYVQTIQPEKATVLNSLAPAGFAEITPRLALIEARIAEQNRAGNLVRYYRTLVTPLRACHQAGVSPFLRVSDGYRIIGAQLASYQLLDGIAANMPERMAEFDAISALCRTVEGNSGTLITGGDLANQFILPMYEAEAVPDLRAMQPYEARLERQEQTASGATCRSWTNDKALSPLKVLMVGAGCFGDGTQPRSVSWWFKSLFARVTLLDADELSPDLLDQEKPDVVLCEVMERKLPKPVKS